MSAAFARASRSAISPSGPNPPWNSSLATIEPPFPCRGAPDRRRIRPTWFGGTSILKEVSMADIRHCRVPAFHLEGNDTLHENRGESGTHCRATSVPIGTSINGCRPPVVIAVSSSHRLKSSNVRLCPNPMAKWRTSESSRPSHTPLRVPEDKESSQRCKLRRPVFCAKVVVMCWTVLPPR